MTANMLILVGLKKKSGYEVGEKSSPALTLDIFPFSVRGLNASLLRVNSTASQEIQ